MIFLACMKAFVMNKFVDPKKNSIKKWFATCKKMQLPYVVVTHREWGSVIEWDYTHFEKDIQKIIRFEASEISRLLMLLLRKYGNQNTMFEGAALVGTIKGIEPINAERLANEIFDLIVKYSHYCSPKLKAYAESTSLN